VVFEWQVWNRSGTGAAVEAGAVRLEYESEGFARRAYAEVLTVGNRAAPARIPNRARISIQAVFVLPEDAEPLELRFSGGFAGSGVRYLFK
jgi:hypothetical protein